MRRIVATTDLRITNHPFLKFDRSKKFDFEFRGKKISAYDGESVGAALYASGVKVFSRSFRLHRPRGMYCVSGKCPNCMMTVNSTPNSRTCTLSATPGMRVESQNAWPSLETDVYSLLDRFSFLLPSGFQYKLRPELWPIFEKLIRRTAGLGRLPRVVAQGSKEAETTRASPEIAIIGAGPAGMSAALQAGRLGADAMLIDDASRLGGRLRLQTAQFQGPSWWGGLRGFEIVEELAKQISSFDNVAVSLNSTAFGLYPENILGVESPSGLLLVHPKKLVVATGCYDSQPVFINNDLPGIFVPIGLQTLMHHYGVRPGLVGMISTNNDFGYELAGNMVDAGMRVAGIVDERQRPTRNWAADAPVLSAATVTEAVGHNSLSKIRVRSSEGSSRSFSCDVLCAALGAYPSNELLFQLGCEMRYSSQAGGYVPARKPQMQANDNCYAIGGSAGTYGLASAMMEGSIAGAAACLSLGRMESEAASIIQKEIEMARNVDSR